jgi:hypothetical protein
MAALRIVASIDCSSSFTRDGDRHRRRRIPLSMGIYLPRVSNATVASVKAIDALTLGALV